MSDLISVIIPVYNVEKYLNKCVESVLNQTYKNLQIILVDDGSTDLSGAICDEYKQKDNRIEVIHKINGGLSSARNAGMKLAKGEFISFIDSDDWLELTFYEKMKNFIEEHSIDIVMCGAKIIRDNSHVEDRFMYFENNCLINRNEALEMIFKDKIGSQVWCKLAKKDLWNDVEFPEGRIYEDIPVTYKLFVKSTSNIGFIAEPLYNYVLHGNSISFKKNPIKSYHIYLGFKERFEYVRDNFIQFYDYSLALACDHALYTCSNYYIYGYKELEPILKNIEKFLYENKKEILKSEIFSFKRKMLFICYFSNKTLFKLMLLTNQKVKKGINNFLQKNR